MGGTYLIRHFTVLLFWSSPGTVPTEVDAAVALPATAPGRLAEAVLVVSLTSQLGGRGAVSWLHFPGTSDSVALWVAQSVSGCTMTVVQSVLSSEDRRHQAMVCGGYHGGASLPSHEVILWRQVAPLCSAALPTHCTRS